jgi:hypothetical protein
MNPKDILDCFVGKQIQCVNTDGRYEVEIKCNDGTILIVKSNGCEGSRLEVEANVRVSSVIDFD